MFQKDHWWAAGRIDGRGRETLDSASQIIIPLTQWYSTGLWRKRKSVRVRVTMKIFQEEVGLEKALEVGEGYARQRNSMNKGRERG